MDMMVLLGSIVEIFGSFHNMCVCKTNFKKLFKKNINLFLSDMELVPKESTESVEVIISRE